MQFFEYSTAASTRIDHDRCDDTVREYYRRRGFTGGLIIKHSTDGHGNVQTIIFSDSEVSVPWTEALRAWMMMRAADLPGSRSVSPWGDSGIKVIWDGA